MASRRPVKGEITPIAISLTSLKGADNNGYIVDNPSSNNGKNTTPISIISQPDPNSSSRVSFMQTPALKDVTTNGSSFPGTDEPSNLESGSDSGSGSPGAERRPNNNNNSNNNTSRPKSAMELKRSINLLYCTAILVAVTGHSSIFIAPSQIISVTGSLGGALVVWLVGGFINMGTALCFAEMGTMYPKAGGPYSYAMISFGPLMGFLIMWGYTILIAGPFWAFLAYTAALYIIRPIFKDCMPDEVLLATRLLAGWIMVTFVVLNCVYMKYVTKIQTLLSSSKILVLLIIIGAGLYNVGKGDTENLENMFEGTTTEPGQIALGLFYSVFAYGGWQVMTTMLEEIKNPAKDPPRAVYISFTIVIVKYVITNAAYGTLMTPKDILESPAIALDFVDRVSSPLMVFVSVLVALTSIGALNASIMGHSRLLFAGARNGHMPQILGMIHTKYKTPWPSIFVFTVWGLIMLFTGGVSDMIDFISLFSTIMTLVVISSLLYLRWTKPDQERPYKTWLFIPVAEMVINIAILILAISEKPHKMGIGLAILFAGIPVYWLGVLWQSKPKEYTSIIDQLTMFAQKILLVSKTKQS